MALSVKTTDNQQRMDVEQEEEGLSIDLMTLIPLDKVSWTEHGGSYFEFKINGGHKEETVYPPDSLGF